MTAHTPMMQQYQAIKANYPDCILFYRLGDFYEMFGEDALTGSRELEIVLTARDKGGGGRIPMCGIPYHAAEGYIARLINKGYKVAICEQVEDPKSAKGIVKREVVRVITPGTLMESALLKEESHNYLMAVSCNRQKENYGLAYTDISTGQFFATEISGPNVLEKLADEISRISPAECILPPTLYEEDFFNLRLLGQGIGSLSKTSDSDYIKNNARALLCIQFKVAAIEALGLGELPEATLACAMLLDFLQTTQKRNLEYLNRLEVYSTSGFMVLDANTRRNLEISNTIRSNQRKGSLLWVCDDTKTPMGARLLKDWLEKPLLKAADINLRLDAVEELMLNPLLLNDFRAMLKGIYDLERIISRISYGSAGPRDLAALKHSLERLPELFRLFSCCQADLYRAFLDDFDPLEDIAFSIAETLIEDPPLSSKEGGLILEGYHAEVDELRRISSGGKEWLAKMEAAEREKTGIKSLKIGYNKVFGYYLEVTHANKDLVPGEYIRKQTLVNAERYITEELKEWENKIVTASERLYNLEYELFCRLREEIGRNAMRIREAAAIVAQLDCLQSLAQVALENDYCRPQVDDGKILRIKDGRHPVVEKIIGREHYVPNDTLLDEATQQLIILTGPNMTGKSTYMRQVALMVLMARAGSFIPASEALIGKIDRIFTRVGASDDLAAGQSTFMVEMCETSNILRHATGDSLIILDEIGRGTSTFDGLSIAWAVAEYIMSPNCGAKTLFATHYHELTALAEDFPLIKNYAVAVKEKAGEIIFLRKIVPGGADRSYGIQVASLAGLPPEVISRAKVILQQLEEENRRLNPRLYTHTPAPQPEPKEKHALVAELTELDINHFSPLMALNWLHNWQKQLREEKE